MNGLRLHGWEAATRPDRLYPVRTVEGYGLYAGRTADRRQLLAAADGHFLLVMLFDSTGDFKGSHRWNLTSHEQIENSLRQRFGWEAGLVRVKQFRIPSDGTQPRDPMQAALVGEEGFAITPFPLDWASSINDPAGLGVEQEDFTAMVQGWIDRGNFALYWGNEYHLDGSGEFVGS
jgi:hypothetical protein